MNLMLSIFLIISLLQYCHSIVWYFEACRITTSSNGTFSLCEQKADCANQATGSTVQCSQYTYTQLSLVYDCINVCCYQLRPVPTQLNGTLVQQCYNQAMLRGTLFVVKIVFIVTGIIGFIVFLIACYVCAFVTNPYTGSKVYVGCCCCKKVPDFEKYRKQKEGSSSEIARSEKNVMNKNEKKIAKIEIS